MENAILWGWLENNPTNQINAQIASFSSPQPPSLERQLVGYWVIKEEETYFWFEWLRGNIMLAV